MSIQRPEARPKQIRQELRDVAVRIAAIPDEATALRGLYRLYFGSKADSNWDEKEFLLMGGFSYYTASSLSLKEETAIFKEESDRLRASNQETKTEA
jgi:hypothetical protein